MGTCCSFCVKKDNLYIPQKNNDAWGECAICLEYLSNGKIEALPCGHVFHSPCLKQWFQRKSYCPLCYSTI
jgi:hypothetical protein